MFCSGAYDLFICLTSLGYTTVFNVFISGFYKYNVYMHVQADLIPYDGFDTLE